MQKLREKINDTYFHKKRCDGDMKSKLAVSFLLGLLFGPWALRHHADTISDGENPQDPFAEHRLPYPFMYSKRPHLRKQVSVIIVLLLCLVHQKAAAAKQHMQSSFTEGHTPDCRCVFQKSATRTSGVHLICYSQLWQFSWPTCTVRQTSAGETWSALMILVAVNIAAQVRQRLSQSDFKSGAIVECCLCSRFRGGVWAQLGVWLYSFSAWRLRVIWMSTLSCNFLRICL